MDATASGRPATEDHVELGETGMQADPSTGGIVVREARTEEYAAAGEVVAAAYLSLTTPEVGWYLDEIRDVAKRASLVPVLVAVDEATGEVLGSVTFVPGPGPYAESEDPFEAGFRMLGVTPRAQGRGIGRLLVEACIASARDRGARRISLLTRESMVAARALYGQLGFRLDPDGDVDPVPGVHLQRFVLALENE